MVKNLNARSTSCPTRYGESTGRQASSAVRVSRRINAEVTKLTESALIRIIHQETLTGVRVCELSGSFAYSAVKRLEAVRKGCERPHYHDRAFGRPDRKPDSFEAH